MNFLIPLVVAFILWIPAALADDVAAVKAAARERYSVPAQGRTAKDLVTWYKLRLSDNAGFHEAEAFVRTHPDWPDLYAIRIKAEEALNPSIPSRQVINWFASYTPVTATGMTHYLNALIATGQVERAMHVLKEWWIDAVLTPGEQEAILQRFGKYLGSQDHKRRLRRILPAGHYTASRALAERLGGGYPELTEARIGLIAQKPNVNQLIARVPAGLRNDESLMLARLQWRRKNDEDAGAMEMLEKAPPYNQMAHPEDWWHERHVMARRLIEEGKWGSAYALVADHRQKEGFPFAQAEWLAGWIALRKIGKPWEAFEHFERMFNAVETPISRSRGAYWAGLASDALSHPEVAMQWYHVAAKYQTTYYGQMAAQKINLPLGLLTGTAIHIDEAARRRFRADPRIAAALLLRRAGQENDAKRFLNAYSDDAKSGLDYVLVAELATALGMNDVAVRAAKSAERAGYVMPDYLFPRLQNVMNGRYAVDPAFILGIIRQESAFDQHAISRSGALGLMQLMPATAAETASRNGLRHSKAWLTSNPHHNITLGALYIDQMMRRFDGNLTLAIAAYNAGPGRVSGWIEEFGDPRRPGINEVDWIETIPIYETRNYVQRVTEALNVYSRMLGRP